MTDSFVTQCPHCRTSFRVSSSQLGAAQGAVRCGACLHVFNAHQHLLDKPKASTPGVAGPAVPLSPTPMPTATNSAPAAELAPIQTATTARKDPLDSVWIHDDLDLDSLDLDEELARLEQEEQLHAQTFVPLETHASLKQPSAAAVTAQPTADERWAEQLLEESQQPAVTPAEAAEVAAAEPEPTAAAEQIEQDHLSDDLGRQEPTLDASEEAIEAQQPDEEIEEIELTATESHARTTSSFRHNETLFDLSDDPLQLEWQAPSKPWGRWLGWGLLNLLAAGALVSQYSLYHFEELARQDKYRPWFEAICPQLGCTLPSKVDINLIKSSNLVVRSHPDFAGALVVDAILYNRASFSQPFPLLELRFSDMDNQLLANRRFKPSEYLAGELAGQDEMPPQTPIHISLDILDPGQEAVNYSLTFQSPE